MVAWKPMRAVLVLMFGFLLLSGMVLAQGALQDAKNLCDQGQFARALELFTRISAQGGDSAAVKEARYYIGFCKVRLQDYWGAVSAFEDFLRQYESANLGDQFRFVPDALYVLGRTYEQVNSVPKAVAVYQRCVAHFAHSEFAAKCRERLQTLGPVGPGPGPGPGPYPQPDSAIIDEIVKMAKAAPTYAQQDQILLSGLHRAANGRDVLKLANAASSNGTKDDICLQGVPKCYSVKEVVALAKATATYAKQDQVCLAGLHICRDGREVLELANATASNGAKDQVLTTGLDRCQTVEEVVLLAKATATYAKQDEICRQGLQRCRTGRDVLQLAGAAASNGAKDEVLLGGVSRCMNVDEVIALAKATATYGAQDQVCIRGVRIIRTFDEATRLANATASSGAQQKVLDEARQILLNGGGYRGPAGRGRPAGDRAAANIPGVSLSMETTTADASPAQDKPAVAPQGDKPVARKRIVNPFEDLKVDQDRLTRINRYLQSVRAMKDVEECRKSLKPADLSLEAVKDATRKYHQKQSFDRAHGEK